MRSTMVSMGLAVGIVAAISGAARAGEGACCLPTGTCTQLPLSECLSAGGSHNGNGTACNEIEPCPVCRFEDPFDRDADGTPRETCPIGVVDRVNSGCNGGSPGNLFSTINCGETVCGSTAYNGTNRDLDWYHLQIQPGGDNVVVRVENNLAAGNLFLTVRFYQQQTGLPACNPVGAFTVFQRFGIAPGAHEFPATLDGGRYTMTVGYDFDTPGDPTVPCPGHYRLSVECGVPTCTAACADSNCDGAISVGDIAFFVTAVASGQSAWSALFPGGNPPCGAAGFVCANDANGDGAVSVGDIGDFVARVASGTPCP